MTDYRHRDTKAVRSAEPGTPEHSVLEADPDWQECGVPPVEPTPAPVPVTAQAETESVDLPDLSTMDKDELIAVAKDRNLNVNPTQSVKLLREQIAAAKPTDDKEG